MTQENNHRMPKLPTGVMLNAYPDSIGHRLTDTIELLDQPEFKDAFSLFYILPTFFNSDLDRGFSIIDYDLNEELVSRDDLAALERLGIKIKLDLVLNHLSVRSSQFEDLLEHGDDSPYRDFFIDWDEFWKDHGRVGKDGHLVPDQEHLDKLFMRKPEMPILRVRFPDGSLRAYWNTFYQKVDFDEITALDFSDVVGLDAGEAADLADHVGVLLKDKGYLSGADLERFGDQSVREAIVSAVCHKRDYLGQMDLNAQSDQVWAFYEETLRKLSEYGARIIRLDAFAYLHKAPGQPNFFNRPGTWEYLERLREMAKRYELTIFPEIHAEYGTGIYAEIAAQGYPIYDFFFPGLVIDALDRGDACALKAWIAEVRDKGLQTITMLGCHDGIPVLDLRGKEVEGVYRPGLLEDEHIDAAVQRIIDRGGMTKELYGADGRKISYYQVNATFFSALGEDERKLVLARAIQMFMPGVPQVWYLDLFAGTNDYAAAKRGRTASHKEINRTTLKLSEVEDGLARSVVTEQLSLIRLRNTSMGFGGELEIGETGPDRLQLTWRHPQETLLLDADLGDFSYTVCRRRGDRLETLLPAE